MAQGQVRGRGGHSLEEEIDWKQMDFTKKPKLIDQLKEEAEQENSKAVANETPLFCHQIVLTLYSARASKLTSGPPSTIELFHELPKDLALLLIQWMYNQGKNVNDPVTPENLGHLYSAAIKLEMKDLVYQLEKITKQQTDPLVLLSFLRCFREANREAMLSFIMEKICDNALVVLDSVELMIQDLEEVMYIFSEDKLNVSAELQVFESARLWLKYRWAERRKSALQLLSCVRFGLLSRMKLVTMEREYKDVLEDPRAKKMIMDALKYKLIETEFGAESRHMMKFLKSSKMAKPVIRSGMNAFGDETSDEESIEWSESTLESVREAY